LIIGSRDFSSEMCMTEALGETAAVGTERVVLSLGNWGGSNFHVATEVGGVGVGLGKLAVEPDGVVSGQLGQPAEDLFVNLGADRTGVLLAGHDPLVNATGDVAKGIAVAFVNDTLESVALPTHVEVAVVHRASSIAVREDEWLLGVLGLIELVVPTASVVVHLVEDTGKVDREFRRAVTTVGSSGTVRDVRLMVGRVDVFSVPAALEVDLSANTARAGCLWEEVVLGGTTVEVQAEERDGLLFGAPHSWRLGGVPGDHAEVIREDGSLSRLVGEEVVGDGATRYELEGTIRILEVQLRIPVCGLVFFDTSGGALRFAEVLRGRDLDSKVGTANDPVDVTGDTPGVHDGVGTFNGENVLTNDEVSPCGCREGEQDERRECDHRYHGKERE
jgi:hypothetical protein